MRDASVQVHVAVDHARHDRAAAGIDHVRVARRLDARARRRDALVVDDDRRVRARDRAPVPSISVAFVIAVVMASLHLADEGLEQRARARDRRVRRRRPTGRSARRSPSRRRSRGRGSAARPRASSPTIATSAGPGGALLVEHAPVVRQLPVHRRTPSRRAPRAAATSSVTRDRQPDDDARRRAPGLLRRRVDRRRDVRLDRLRAGHPRDRAVGQLAGDLEHHRRERRDHHRQRLRARHAAVARRRAEHLAAERRRGPRARAAAAR